MPALMLTDRQWREIEPLLPGKKSDPGRTGDDNRMALEGMLFVLVCGLPWRRLPEEFGKWSTVYRRFRRWTLAGVFKRIGKPNDNRDLRTIMIDATYIKLQKSASGARRNGLSPTASARLQAIGRSHGGLTTKILLVVDAGGRIVDFTLHPGNRHEAPLFFDAVKDIETQEVIADKAYDNYRIRKYLSERGVVAVIPPKSNSKKPVEHDAKRYRDRHLVENRFTDLKHYRAVATRYAKTASSFESFVWLAVRMIEFRTA